MRYSGSEGRASVQSVNFLTTQGTFMGYQDILAARIPENEVYALGLELLSGCKNDWADDWGGKGEITWDLGYDISIEHQDRSVDEIELKIIFPEKDLKKTIDHVELPATEISSLSKIGCKIVYNGDKPVMGNYMGSKSDEDFSFSRKLLDGASFVLQAASTHALSKTTTGTPVEATITWSMGAHIEVDLISELETFTKIDFTVPARDVKDLAV